MMGCGFHFPWFFFLIIGLQAPLSLSLTSQGSALLKFRARVNSDPHGTLANWNVSGINDLCYWSGVTCVDGKVQILDLSGYSLEGTLAPELSQLSDLRSLILSRNHFSGGIPKEYGSFENLEVLDLRENDLSGQIPPELSNGLSLKHLLLSGNKFSDDMRIKIVRLQSSYEVRLKKSPKLSPLAVLGCINRKLGHCVSRNRIIQVKKVEAIVFRIKATSRRFLKAFPSFLEETDIYKRRELLEETSNLAAEPAPSAPSPSPGIITEASPRSSGSFPAVTNAKKRRPPLVPPVPSPDKGSTSPDISKNQPQDNKQSKGSKHVWLYVVIAVASFVGLLIIVAVIFFCRKRAVKSIGPWKTGLSGQLQKAFVTGVPKLNRSELETACEDFSNIIETFDGYTVYKGTLSSGVEIAVASTAIAESKEWTRAMEMAYRRKIDTLSRINHKNFVNLIGYCEEDDPFNRMMVFEYAPNGTLFEHLHDKETEHLDWSARMRIIMGTAYCLQHMHGMNPPMAHTDFNSSEIYLTDDYAAKVSEIPFNLEARLNPKKHVSGGSFSTIRVGLLIFSRSSPALIFRSGSKFSKMAGNQSLKDYLKKYESSDVVEKKKKKKKQKKPSKPEPRGVLVVDEDPVWQKQVDPEEDENEDDSAEETPLVDEDIEVKRMRRLEEIKARRAHNAIAEDGSGWVTLPLNREDTQSNISPPRRQRTRNDSPSPEPGPRRSVADRVDTDMSPPRRRKRHNSPSPEPNRKHTKPVSLDSDMSPPRKRKARNDSPSPEPEAKYLSEDLSPPRRRHVHSPSRESSRKRSDSVELDDDLSPPRRKRDLHGSPVSDVKKKSNDLSPPRRRRYHSPSPEPARRSSKSFGSNADLSPPGRNINMKDSQDSDLSPQRKAADLRRSSENVSRSSNFDSSPPRRPRRDSSPPQISKEQRKTGLISGKDIGSEYRKKKEDEKLRFKNMDSELTGQNAEAVFRDKITGKRISKEEYLKSKQKKVIEKPKEIKLEWGKGLAQKREAEARLQELELEKDKPFARTRDDPELDQMMKERVRFGDPMAHLVKKRKYETTLVDLGDDEEMKKSGFIIPQSVPKHSWLTRRLEAASNRYGIKPGRHWDGVDRSNGTEKDLIKKTNERKATEIEAYLWSVADM